MQKDKGLLQLTVLLSCRGTLARPRARRLEDLHESYQKTRKKIFNCHANERQMDSNQAEGKEGQGAAGFPSRVGGIRARACLCRGLGGVSGFYRNSRGEPLGEGPNHDLRRVETALETIVLCEGRRSWGGASADRGGLHSGPAVLSSCLNLCLRLMSHMQFQFGVTLT